jgi:hypothetical protein
MFAV